MSCILLDFKEFALLCDAEEFGLLLEAEVEDKLLDSSSSFLRGGEGRTPRLFPDIEEFIHVGEWSGSLFFSSLSTT